MSVELGTSRKGLSIQVFVARDMGATCRLPRGWDLCAWLEAGDGVMGVVDFMGVSVSLFSFPPLDGRMREANRASYPRLKAKQRSRRDSTLDFCSWTRVRASS